LSVSTGGSSIAIGNGASTSTYATSVAIGKLALCTATNQIRLGTSGTDVSIPGTTTATGLITANGGVSFGATTQNSAFTGGTPGTYTNTNMTIDTNGKISAIANGSSGGVPTLSAVLTAGNSAGGLSITNLNDLGLATLNVSSNLNMTGTTSVIDFSEQLGEKIVLYGTSGTNNYGLGIQNSVLQIHSDSSTSRVGIGYGYSASFTETLTIKGSNVGIGTTTPAHALDVNGELRCRNRLFIGVNDPGGGTGDTAYLEYVAFSGEKTVLRIVTMNDIPGSVVVDNINLNPSGNVGIKTDDPQYALDINGSCRATTFVSGSDYRLKTNIEPLLSSRTIDDLKPVEYDLSGNTHDMGFIAHEVEEVLPFLVRGEKDGKNMQSLNYNGFIALLTKEIQELKRENTILKERLDKLESKILY
jgi:hypothetical protein